MPVGVQQALRRKVAASCQQSIRYVECGLDFGKRLRRVVAAYPGNVRRFHDNYSGWPDPRVPVRAMSIDCFDVTIDMALLGFEIVCDGRQRTRAWRASVPDHVDTGVNPRLILCSTLCAGLEDLFFRLRYNNRCPGNSRFRNAMRCTANRCPSSGRTEPHRLRRRRPPPLVDGFCSASTTRILSGIRCDTSTKKSKLKYGI